MKNSKFLLFVCFILVFSSSCSRTSHLINKAEPSAGVAEFNYLGNQRTGYIELSNGSTITSKWLNFKADTINYISANSDSLQNVSVDQIKYVYFKDHLISTFDGVLIGFVCGFIPGLMFYDSSVHMSGLISFAIGLSGSAAGAIVGIVKGSKLKYIIHSRDLPVRELQQNKY